EVSSRHLLPGPNPPLRGWTGQWAPGTNPRGDTVCLETRSSAAPQNEKARRFHRAFRIGMKPKSARRQRRQADFHAAVLLAARRRIVRRDGLALARAADVEADRL